MERTRAWNERVHECEALLLVCNRRPNSVRRPCCTGQAAAQRGR